MLCRHPSGLCRRRLSTKGKTIPYTTATTRSPAPTASHIKKEGVFVGYRGYEQNHVKPQFPFGFGLSYTTFKYSNLSVKALPGSISNYQVSFDATNIGERCGAAAAQLYVSDPPASIPRHPRELKGFRKLFLKPGETRQMSIPLTSRSFRITTFKQNNGVHTSGSMVCWSVLRQNKSNSKVMSACRKR